MTDHASRFAKRIRVNTDARVVAVSAWSERVILIALLVLLYLSYGAIGRDVFVNRLMYKFGAAIDDPIGAVLPYVRVALCLATLFLVTLSTDVKWVLSKVPWMLSPFIVVALASTLWADDPKDTLRNGIMTTVMWLAMPPLIHRLGLITSARVALHVIAAVCVLSFVLALAAPSIGRHTGLEVVQGSHIGEWRGLFAHKNLLGPWAAWGSVFCFTHSRLCPGPRLVWWFAGLSALTCLIFSHSATSEIVMAAMWVFWLGFMALRRLTLSAVFLLYVAPVLAAGSIIFAFKSELLDLLDRDQTFTGRTIIWAIDRDTFLESPWLGHGFQTLGGPTFIERLFTLFNQPLSPESGYWAMLLDVGVVGFVLFVIPYLVCIRNGFEWLKHVVLADRAAIEMFILILISSLITSVTETQILLSTGYDGVLSFTALFSLLTTPKSPRGVLRGEFRLAKYRIAPFRQGDGSAMGGIRER